jgi:hypothetical protein
VSGARAGPPAYDGPRLLSGERARHDGGVSAAAPSRPATHVLEAVLERLTYVNEETEYTVARVATGRGSDLLTVVGALLAARRGESLRLHR